MVALTGAGKLNVAGLIVAAAGILTLFVTGVAKQAFPVGVVLLVAVAAEEDKLNSKIRTTRRKRRTLFDG